MDPSALRPLADIQPLVLGVTLAWAGWAKTFSPRSTEILAKSAFPSLIRADMVAGRRAYFGVGAIEIILGSLLVIPPPLKTESLLAIGAAVGFLVYLALARRAAPDRPCGCLGTDTSRITWEDFARALLVLGTAVLSLNAQRFWLSAMMDDPWLFGVAGIELMVLTAIPHRLIARTRLTKQQATGSDTRATDCATAGVSLAETLRQLRQSEAFHAVAARLVSSSPSDHWRDGCWRYLAFAATYEGQQAVAVFAVPTVWYPQMVRVVLLDNEDDVLLRFPEDAKPVLLV